MPADIDLFRKLALSLPQAFESAHMGSPDFRIASPDGKGRIFATLASQAKGCGNLMLTPEQQQSFVAELPDVFEPIFGGWGRMGMTHIHLHQADEDVLLGALATAHRNVASKLAAGKSKVASKGKPKAPAVRRAKKTVKRSSLE